MTHPLDIMYLLDKGDGVEQEDPWNIDNGCTHDWNFINGDEGTMKCEHCGCYQN